jgi:hypothetical protein
MPSRIPIGYPYSIVLPNGGGGHIATRIAYSHYHCRVDYRFDEAGSSTNAGFLYHLNEDSEKLYNHFPRSVECQMKNNEAGWTFLISWVWMTSTVDPNTVDNDTKRFMPAVEGGVEAVQGNRDPWRVVIASQQYDVWQEWNTLEVIVYGSDSVTHIINGHVVNGGTNMRYNVDENGTYENSLPLEKGSIGLQAEGQEVWYRNWEIRLLPGDSSYITPIAGCMDTNYLEYDSTADVHDSLACLNLGIRRMEQSVGRQIAFHEDGAGRINIIFRKNSRYRLKFLDLKGGEVLSKTVQGPDVFHISSRSLAGGIYSLIITADGKPYNKRLTKLLYLKR